MEGNRLKQVALLIVDMQNDFVRRGAPLEVPDARNTIAPHLALLQAFRRRGWPVVYTRFLSRQEPNLTSWCGDRIDLRTWSASQQYYNLSHLLYRQFLDQDLQYSCAYFRDPHAPLDEAQRAKDVTSLPSHCQATSGEASGTRYRLRMGWPCTRARPQRAR